MEIRLAKKPGSAPRSFGRHFINRDPNPVEESKYAPPTELKYVPPTELKFEPSTELGKKLL